MSLLVHSSIRTLGVEFKSYASVTMHLYLVDRNHIVNEDEDLGEWEIALG